MRDENLWLTQKRIADLFGVGIPAINKHLKNIFESSELHEDSVISIMEITAELFETACLNPILIAE